MFAKLVRYFVGFLIGLLSAAVILPFNPVAVNASPHYTLRTIGLADRLLEFSDATLTLMDKPCEIGLVLDGVKPENRKLVKGGTVKPKYPGSEPHRLCYYEENGVVALIDEFGNNALVASEAFEPVVPKAKKRGQSF